VDFYIFLEVLPMFFKVDLR